MFSEEVAPELAAQIEACEAHAWADMYDAAPADFMEQFGLEFLQVQNVALTRCKRIPFIHFNCVKNLGMNGPATEALLDEILALYHAAEVTHFAVYHIPHSRPPALPEWLHSRNLHPQGGWDRIYRDSRRLIDLDTSAQNEFVVEKVTPTTAPEWSAFIDAIYGLPTTPWLLSLVGRPGWHHYLLRRGTEVAAVRSMHIDGAGFAWFGIDAPVPGLMAPSYDLDSQLCRAMVTEGLELGVKYFVADIEAPDTAMATPAYSEFEALGFKRPYFRSHYRY